VASGTPKQKAPKSESSHVHLFSTIQLSSSIQSSPYTACLVLVWIGSWFCDFCPRIYAPLARGSDGERKRTLASSRCRPCMAPVVKRWTLKPRKKLALPCTVFAARRWRRTHCVATLIGVPAWHHRRRRGGGVAGESEKVRLAEETGQCHSGWSGGPSICFFIHCVPEQIFYIQLYLRIYIIL
jgi:hypothetical protein